ncbi:hypothetical protein Scep_024310 [Stephania cephalantha]|uniref:Uncharacterized protein n=1 Tax=Stephania cephalantha TaxID=152367 RepID=A0AAP0EZ28_9MAGN
MGLPRAVPECKARPSLDLDDTISLGEVHWNLIGQKKVRESRGTSCEASQPTLIWFNCKFYMKTREEWTRLEYCKPSTNRSGKEKIDYYLRVSGVEGETSRDHGFMVKRSAQLNPGRKNTQNGVFTCSDQMPEDLPRVTCCAAGRIGDSRPSKPPHVTFPLDKHVISSVFFQSECSTWRQQPITSSHINATSPCHNMSPAGFRQ